MEYWPDDLGLVSGFASGANLRQHGDCQFRSHDAGREEEDCSRAPFIHHDASGEIGDGSGDRPDEIIKTNHPWQSRG